MTLDSGELDIFSRTIWGEARGESLIGQLAVGYTIHNRLGDDRWPDTYEKVCRQPKQFSCWNEDDANRQACQSITVDYFPFKVLRLFITEEIIRGSTPDPTLGANHYLTMALAKASPPKWYDVHKVTAYIGRHVFLKL